MNGPTHGLSGAVAGLGLGAGVGATPKECLLLAAAGFVGAYIPDIDHRRATITRLVPGVGSVASWVARKSSGVVYRATKGRRDENHQGEHRHLTHTVAFAVALGFLVRWGVIEVAERFGAADPTRLGWLVGAGVAAGCVAHCLGDALTIMGCPFLWPIPIRGETFYEIRPPRLLRFRTGGPVEKWLITPALLVGLVLLIPGVWPLAGPVLLDAGHGAVEALR